MSFFSNLVNASKFAAIVKAIKAFLSQFSASDLLSVVAKIIEIERGGIVGSAQKFRALVEWAKEQFGSKPGASEALANLVDAVVMAFNLLSIFKK